MKKHYLSRLMLDWVLVITGVFGSMFCLISAFKLPVPPDLWGLVLISTVFNCAILGHRKYGKYVALVLLAGILLFVWLLRHELSESFRNLWGELARRYALGYDRFLDYIPREPTTTEATGSALLALAIGQSLAVSVSVRQWKRTFPAALALMTGIAPCFVLLDTKPDLPPLLLAVFSVLTQAFSQSVRRRGNGEERKAVCLSALLAAGLLALLLAVFPEKGYKPPITWAELNRQMSRWSQEQNNHGNVNAGLSGNPDAVELRSLGALPNHPSTALYVRVTRAGGYYLRGTSYTHFDGDTWTRGELRDWEPEMLFPYLQPGTGETMSIESVARENVYYTTYQTTALPAGGQVISDSYVRNESGETTYTLRYLPAVSPKRPDSSYDAWVTDACLDVPAQTREGVLEWWSRNSDAVDVELSRPAQSDLSSVYYAPGSEPRYRLQVPGDGSAVVVVTGSGWTNEIPYSMTAFRLLTKDDPNYAGALEAFAQAVADRISRCAAYSRNPMRVPDGEDFCTWFLNDAENGYCVHYASACTALLRSLGIPARYASGYICTLKADENTAVTNLQAHAWVEIWCGGRWLPIEPTPDNATEFTGTAYSPSQNRPNADPDATDFYPTEFTRPQTIETVPSPTGETQVRPRPMRPTVDPTEPETPPADEKKPIDLTPLWILLGAAGALALILGRRAVALHLWEDRLARAGLNERACMIYRRIVRLRRLSGGELPEDMVRLAYRAAYSQHELKQEEVDYLRQYLDRETLRLSHVSLWKSLYAKFILAIA